MVGMENNNKESFKLLGVTPSTDSASDVPEIVLAPPRKKKIRRFVLAFVHRFRNIFK